MARTVLGGDQGGTGVNNSGKTVTLGGNLTLSGAFATTFTVTATTGVTFPTTGTLATRAGTETFTNKRITQRIGTVTSSATPTPVGDSNDMFTVTALAVGATFASPGGTPTDGQPLEIRVKDNGSAQTLAWNAIYRAGTDLALPTTTVAGKTAYYFFKYNAADTKWDYVGNTGGF